MKLPWWIHITAGCVLALSGIAAWHSWMISTREDPVVILHRHLWISEPAWLDDHEHQAMWQEFFKIENRVKAQSEVIDATAELAKATSNTAEKWGLYANELYNKIEAAEADIKAMQKQIKRQKPCGGW